MDSGVEHLPPGDPQLIANIVNRLKSQGMFDQFRRDCLADVDTKPAYQNLRQRGEGYVAKFLAQQTWKPDLNKNALRDSLRRHINESGMLALGVEHLVEQVVNPKIYTVFLPAIELAVNKYLGLEKDNDQQHLQASTSSSQTKDQADQQRLNSSQNAFEKVLISVPPPPPPFPSVLQSELLSRSCTRQENLEDKQELQETDSSHCQSCPDADVSDAQTQGTVDIEDKIMDKKSPDIDIEIQAHSLIKVDHSDGIGSMKASDLTDTLDPFTNESKGSSGGSGITGETCSEQEQLRITDGNALGNSEDVEMKMSEINQESSISECGAKQEAKWTDSSKNLERERKQEKGSKLASHTDKLKSCEKEKNDTSKSSTDDDDSRSIQEERRKSDTSLSCGSENNQKQTDVSKQRLITGITLSSESSKAHSKTSKSSTMIEAKKHNKTLTDSKSKAEPGHSGTLKMSRSAIESKTKLAHSDPKSGKSNDSQSKHLDTQKSKQRSDTSAKEKQEEKKTGSVSSTKAGKSSGDRTLHSDHSKSQPLEETSRATRHIAETRGDMPRNGTSKQDTSKISLPHTSDERGPSKSESRMKASLDKHGSSERHSNDGPRKDKVSSGRKNQAEKSGRGSQKESVKSSVKERPSSPLGKNSRHADKLHDKQKLTVNQKHSSKTIECDHKHSEGQQSTKREEKMKSLEKEHDRSRGSKSEKRSDTVTSHSNAEERKVEARKPYGNHRDNSRRKTDSPNILKNEGERGKLGTREYVMHHAKTVHCEDSYSSLSKFSGHDESEDRETFRASNVPQDLSDKMVTSTDENSTSTESQSSDAAKHCDKQSASGDSEKNNQKRKRTESDNSSHSCNEEKLKVNNQLACSSNLSSLTFSENEDSLTASYQCVEPETGSVKYNAGKNNRLPTHSQGKCKTLLDFSSLTCHSEGVSGHALQNREVNVKREDIVDEEDDKESLSSWSDVTVSSVHTSDLSDFDDGISLSSSNNEMEDDTEQARKEKKILTLKEVKEIVETMRDRDRGLNSRQRQKRGLRKLSHKGNRNRRIGRHNSQNDSHNANEATSSGGRRRRGGKEQQSSNKLTEHSQEQSSSPVTAETEDPRSSHSDGVPGEVHCESKMGLRRQRKVNPRYASDEFSSIFNRRPPSGGESSETSPAEKVCPMKNDPLGDKQNQKTLHISSRRSQFTVFQRESNESDTTLDKRHANENLSTFDSVSSLERDDLCEIASNAVQGNERLQSGLADGKLLVCSGMIYEQEVLREHSHSPSNLAGNNKLVMDSAGHDKASLPGEIPAVRRRGRPSKSALYKHRQILLPEVGTSPSHEGGVERSGCVADQDVVDADLTGNEHQSVAMNGGEDSNGMVVTPENLPQRTSVPNVKKRGRPCKSFLKDHSENHLPSTQSPISPPPGSVVEAEESTSQKMDEVVLIDNFSEMPRKRGRPNKASFKTQELGVTQLSDRESRVEHLPGNQHSGYDESVGTDVSRPDSIGTISDGSGSQEPLGLEREHQTADCPPTAKKRGRPPKSSYKVIYLPEVGTSPTQESGTSSKESSRDSFISNPVPHDMEQKPGRPDSQPSTKRYDSSDLYKPRPVISSGTRRSRGGPVSPDLPIHESDESEKIRRHSLQEDTAGQDASRGLNSALSGRQRGRPPRRSSAPSPVPNYESSVAPSAKKRRT